MREIHLTPIPAAEHGYSGDREEIELVCHECDVVVRAEGYELIGLVGSIDAWHRTHHEKATDQAHRQRHQREGGGA